MTLIPVNIVFVFKVLSLCLIQHVIDYTLPYKNTLPNLLLKQSAISERFENSDRKLSDTSMSHYLGKYNRY